MKFTVYFISANQILYVLSIILIHFVIFLGYFSDTASYTLKVNPSAGRVAELIIVTNVQNKLSND